MAANAAGFYNLSKSGTIYTYTKVVSIKACFYVALSARFGPPASNGPPIRSTNCFYKL